MTQGVLPLTTPHPLCERTQREGGEGEGNEPREPAHGQVCPYHNGRNSGAEKKSVSPSGGDICDLHASPP